MALTFQWKETNQQIGSKNKTMVFCIQETHLVQKKFIDQKSKDEEQYSVQQEPESRGN